MSFPIGFPPPMPRPGLGPQNMQPPGGPQGLGPQGMQPPGGPQGFGAQGLQSPSGFGAQPGLVPGMEAPQTPPGWDGRSSFAAAGSGEQQRLQQMARSLGTELGRPVDVQGVLAVADTNRDGRVSNDEARAARSADLDNVRAYLDALRMRR